MVYKLLCLVDPNCLLITTLRQPSREEQAWNRRRSFGGSPGKLAGSVLTGVV
jgi:hypothetical protein